MKMMIDVDGSAEMLLELYPEMTMGAALRQACYQIEEGSLAAATAWARVAAMLAENDVLIKNTTKIVA